MIKKKSSAELAEEILEELEENTGLTALAAGSSAAVLVNIIARKLGELYGDMEFHNAMAFLSTSRGVYLDWKGEEFGVTRIEAQPAIAYAVDRIIKFYCTTGVLKDHIPVGYISAGTEIYNADSSITYRTASNFYFSDTDNECYVTAGALESGKDYNVGKGELVSHSLSAANVLVTNTAAIQNGDDVESNDNLRYRVSNAPLLLATSNMDAIKSAVSVIPGAADILVVPYDQGVGSVGIKIIPVANILTDDVIAQVTALAGAVKAAGDYLHVVGPEYCAAQIAIQLVFDEGVTDGEKAALVVPCENAILNYLASLRMGQIFILNEMIQRVMDTSDLILDMEVKCYSFRGRPQALRNFQPYDEEVFIPDPEADRPIEVFV